MQKEFLNQFKKELKEIKKEGELVDINIEKEDNLETREINYPINRKIKKGIIGAAAALALATGLSVVPNTVSEQAQVVEAATKDKKKPTFKMSGKTTINIEKDKMVQVPKVTAKDNKDGNVTKKITVTVKKGSKSYSSIAKKIKNNKKVKFTEAGKYTITYTVKDKAGNKATKKRYMVVTEPISTYDEKDKEEKTTENTTTEQSTTEKNTEATTEQKTEATTEQPTETPTKPEESTEKEYVLYEYNFADPDDDDLYEKLSNAIGRPTNITFSVENDYKELFLYSDSDDFNKSEYIKYLGKIKAYDKDGNDISSNIIVQQGNVQLSVHNGASNGSYIHLYVSDGNGNDAVFSFFITIIDKCPTAPDLSSTEKLKNEPAVYGLRREKNNILSMNNQCAKKYEYKM